MRISLDEVFEEPVGLRALRGDQRLAALPRREEGEHHQREREREPAAVDDLGQVRAEEGEVDDAGTRPRPTPQPQRLVPEGPDDDEEQDRVDRERAGDGDAVGGGEAGRGPEAEDEPDHGDEEHPVDGGHVDLALGSEVWRIRSSGRKPSATACRVTENAPEITACDAITVARVASTTTGSSAHDGISRKNGLATALGSARIRAPWPR